MANVPFNLRELVDDVVARATSESGERDDTCLVSFASNIPFAVTGDKAALSRVLKDFIEFGTSRASTGAVVIDVDTGGPIDPGRGKLTLRLRLQAPGTGLTSDEASNILTAFLSGSAPADPGGGSETHATGRELIDRMGASVAVECTPGKDFAVSFSAEFGIVRTGRPAAAKRGGPSRRFGDPEMNMPDGLERLRGARILLAEDNPVNQNLAREILVQAGCEVEIAADGRETVDAVRQHGYSFDAILMDVQMPIVDGYEATRQIRTELDQSDVPIIAMTANVLCDERERCLAVGMNDYIAKPFHIPDLYATIIRWIAPSDAQPEHAENVDAPAPGDPALAGAVGGRLPDQIPEIDISTGLVRAMGNRELYADLLAQFARTNRSLAVEIASAIANGDRDRARFLVHGISSSAGNLGAQELHMAARSLEHALAEGGDIDELLAPFQDRLQRVLSGIREAGVELNGRPARLGDGQGPFDRKEASHAAATLAAMLDDQDMAARHHVDRVLELFGGRGRDEQLQSLMVHLEALEFAEAKKLLAGICEDILK